LAGERGDDLALVAAVRAAEFLVAHPADVRIAVPEPLFERGEHFVAAEHEVPHLRDRLALERIETLREGLHLALARAARPERFVISVVGGGHCGSWMADCVRGVLR